MMVNKRNRICVGQSLSSIFYDQDNHTHHKYTCHTEYARRHLLQYRRQGVCWDAASHHHRWCNSIDCSCNEDRHSNGLFVQWEMSKRALMSTWFWRSGNHNTQNLNIKKIRMDASDLFISLPWVWYPSHLWTSYNHKIQMPNELIGTAMLLGSSLYDALSQLQFLLAHYRFTLAAVVCTINSGRSLICCSTFFYSFQMGQRE